ncbi:MAG: hypothetical protein K2X39_00365 [Silvanigrellaceae bacterium]|nr:hypothetical protein [Silvanigrellaceae bacterium]
MQVILLGATGRLGGMIVDILSKKSLAFHTLNRDEVKSIDYIAKLLTVPSVFIDVSAIEGSMHLCYNLIRLPQNCKNAIKGIIIGTTGHNQEHIAHIEQAAVLAPTCLVPNFSRGILLLNEMLSAITSHGKTVVQLAESLGFDIGIFESHHKNKLDSPSGTAISIAKNININIEKITSQRLGETVGEHSILINQAAEEVRITHIAHDRKVFALGAVDLCEKMFQSNFQPGMYAFKDFLV